MAIAFDAQSFGFANAHPRGTSLVYNQTCTGSERFLMVATAGGVIGATTGVTYNSVSMTEIDRYSTAASGFSEIVLWGLINPASGTNSVSVQTSGGGNMLLYTATVSYTGVNQTTPYPHTAKTQSASATSLTLTINTSNSPSTDNCWIACIAFSDGNYTQSAGSGTTKRTVSAAIDNWISFYDNNSAITPPGSDSLVVNQSTAAQIDIIGVSLAPVGGGGGGNTTNFFHLMT